MSTERQEADGDSDSSRRGFVMVSSSAVMTVGLAAAYGTFGVHAGRFLYPAEGAAVGWQYLSAVGDLKLGKAIDYTAPTGAKIVVARQTEGDSAEDFIALSSVCPHLGCQVHWEVLNERFFCPCHNGAFDAVGKAILGPPAQANQDLKRYPLKVENGLLFIQVPLESIVSGPDTVAKNSPASDSDGVDGPSTDREGGLA